jgi:Rod binding domain-containing protein
MPDISKVGQSQAYTPEQKEALKRLHEASQQLEGVFLQMMMSAMRDTVPKDSIFGKESASESTWQDMLDNERSQAIAKQGNFGIAKVLEEQLKSQVLADAPHESHVQVDRRVDP